MTTDNSAELKKRGRKKKVNEETTIDTIVIEESPKEDDKLPPKKRGRKARGAKLIVKNDENISSKPIASTNIILHLKCNLSDLTEIDKFVSDPLTYNPAVPPEVTSYNEENDMFASYKHDEPILDLSLPEKEFICSSCQCQEKTQSTDNTKELNQKLKKLKISLYKNNISSDKVSACFWCSYDFDNSPCYIPKQENNGQIYGYGSFCRPECAVAYLFRENIDDSTKFERYQLLNNVYSKIYDYKKSIKPAPDPHYLLDRFYGQLTIQEYRKLLKTQHLLLVIDKPMTRILPELHDDNEDINYSGNKTGIYKVKRESEREQGPSKTSIIRDKFGLTNYSDRKEK
jgi:hypothetical protein